MKLNSVNIHYAKERVIIFSEITLKYGAFIKFSISLVLNLCGRLFTSRLGRALTKMRTGNSSSTASGQLKEINGWRKKAEFFGWTRTDSRLQKRWLFYYWLAVISYFLSLPVEYVFHISCCLANHVVSCRHIRIKFVMRVEISLF